MEIHNSIIISVINPENVILHFFSLLPWEGWQGKAHHLENVYHHHLIIIRGRWSKSCWSMKIDLVSRFCYEPDPARHSAQYICWPFRSSALAIRSSRVPWSKNQMITFPFWTAFFLPSRLGTYKARRSSALWPDNRKCQLYLEFIKAKMYSCHLSFRETT